MALCDDPVFRRAVAHFNAGEFFEAHDAWEECWTSNFEKGLIQAAVALHQWRRGNLAGARRMYAGFRRYTEAYRPAFGGVDLEAFVSEMERDCAPLARIDETPAFPAGVAPQVRILRGT